MGKWIVEVWRDDKLIKVVETNDPVKVVEKYRDYNIRIYPKWRK